MVKARAFVLNDYGDLLLVEQVEHLDQFIGVVSVAVLASVPDRLPKRSREGDQPFLIQARGFKEFIAKVISLLNALRRAAELEIDLLIEDDLFFAGASELTLRKH